MKEVLTWEEADAPRPRRVFTVIAESDTARIEMAPEDLVFLLDLIAVGAAFTAERSKKTVTEAAEAFLRDYYPIETALHALTKDKPRKRKINR